MRTMASPEFVPTEATTLKRKPERGDYRRDTAYAILDEALVAHVGVAIDGQPFVIPMVYGRDGDRLLLHGSVASRLLRKLDEGLRTCVTVTLLDGLVFARSQRMHSMNYRSVLILGTARRLRNPDHVQVALARIIEHIAPGRSSEARAANQLEQRETTVVELPIEVASVKIRSGGPLPDREEDLAVPSWTGVLPLSLVPGAPLPDELTPPETTLPASLSPWRRPNQVS